MRPRIRIQVMITGTVLLASLLPTLMIGAFLYWYGLQEQAEEAQVYQRHAQVVASQVEQSVQVVRIDFDALLERLALVLAANSQTLAGLLVQIGATDSFQTVQVVNLSGERLSSWVAPGYQPTFRPFGPVEADQLGAGPVFLVEPGVGDLPELFLLGAIPNSPDLFLLADLNRGSLAVKLARYAAVMDLLVYLTPVDAQPALPSTTLLGGAVLADLPLKAWVSPPPHRAVQRGLQRLWLALAFGGLGIAPSAWIGQQVARRIGRALESLRESSLRLASGEHGLLPSQLPRLAPVEVHDLGDTLNHLALRLSETHDALMGAKEDLERRVQERTEELAQRNIDLGYSRATLYAVMESMNDGLLLTTPDQRIRYINRNMEEMLHLAEPLYPGRAIEGFYRAVLQVSESQDLPDERLRDALVDPQVSPVLMVSGRGGKRYLRWRTFSIHNATGAHLGMGHLLTDVTQEHEVDRVKSELISIVSHELRTPLTAIRASISSLLRPNVEWDEETRADFLVTIAEESRHLQELIENLLDMSKIEAGVLRLDLEAASAERLLAEAASRARTLHPDQDLSVIAPPGLPPIRVDRRRMEQVLLNLIGNAVKYAPETRAIEIRAERRGTEVWLAVRDQGRGIPAEHINAVFERFHRVDSTMTRETGGNGLGLAICKGIVDGHGGRIWAESDPGIGSTFYIALPTAEEE